MPGKADGLDKKILELIDLKTNQDMKEVIQEIKTLESKIQNVYWVLGIVGTVMSILLAIITLKK